MQFLKYIFSSNCLLTLPLDNFLQYLSLKCNDPKSQLHFLKNNFQQKSIVSKTKTNTELISSFRYWKIGSPEFCSNSLYFYQTLTLILHFNKQSHFDPRLISKIQTEILSKSFTINPFLMNGLYFDAEWHLLDRHFWTVE